MWCNDDILHVLHQSFKFLVLPLGEGLFQVLKVSFDQDLQKYSVEKLTLAGQLAPLTVPAYDFGEYLEPIQGPLVIIYLQ